MGIGDSWGTREELLHPRDKNGRFRTKWKMATSVVDAITNFLSKFNPRTFQSDAQAGQFLFNTAKPSRFRGGTDMPRLAADFDSANAVLRSGNMDAGTKKFVSMMDENKVDLPDDVILSKVVGPEAFGLTPESVALDDGGIEDFTGKLVADRGYSAANIGTPLGKQAGQITVTMAVPKGTKAIIPARSRNDREIILDRDQEMRITKVEPDGQGGYYMLAVATPRTPGDTPEPIGQSQMVETPAAREARVGQIQQSQTQRTAGNQPTEESVPPVLVSPQQQQAPTAGGPPPRNEPEVTPAIGGPQVPQEPAAPGAPEPEAPATPRIVDLRAAVREANIPVPSRGPRRRDWNQAYMGLTAQKPKDVNDVLRELDKDISVHEVGQARGMGDNDPDLAPDIDALTQLRDVIREKYGVEAPAPVKKAAPAKAAPPVKKAAPGAPRTEAGLPKLERPAPAAKKAAPAKATGGRITAAETRRQAVLEAVKGNTITGTEGHSYRQIAKNLADGDITPAAAKKRATDTAKFMRSSADTARNRGARVGDTDADRKRQRDAGDRIDKVAEQYEKLAADIDAANKAPVKKAAKKAAPAAPEVDPDSPEGREARIRELFDGKKPTVMEMRRHVRDKGIEAPEGSKSPEKMNRDQLIALILGVPSREKDSPKGADQRRSNAEVRRDATKRGTRGGPSVLTPEQQEDIRAAAQRTDDRLKAQAEATDAAVRAKMAPFLEQAGVQESELSDLDRAGFMVVGDLLARGRISRAEAARRLRTDRDSPLNRIADALEAGPAPRKAAPAAPAPAKKKASDHVREIQSLGTSEEVARYLDENPMTAAELREVAKDLGPTVTQGGRTKAAIRQNIVEGTTGFRERSKALFPQGVEGLEDLARRAEAAPAAALKIGPTVSSGRIARGDRIWVRKQGDTWVRTRAKGGSIPLTVDRIERVPVGKQSGYRFHGKDGDGNDIVTEGYFGQNTFYRVEGDVAAPAGDARPSVIPDRDIIRAPVSGGVGRGVALDRGDHTSGQHIASFQLKPGDEVLYDGEWQRVGKAWRFSQKTIIEDRNGKVIAEPRARDGVRARLGSGETPEVNVAGPKVQETITAPDRKSAFREAYTKQKLNLGEGSTRRQVDEVVDDIESGKLTPTEGIERMETEISFNKEELIDMDRTIRETDGEERRTITARRRELANQVKEQERATTFLRDHFKKAPEVTPDEVVITLSPESQDAVQRVTAKDLKEQAEKLGFKVKSRTKKGMLEEITRQMAEQELEKRGLLKKTAPAPRAPEKPKPNLPESQYQRIDVNALAEGLDLRTGWDRDMLNAVQEMLDGKEDRLGKNPTPAQIGRDLEQWANGPAGPFYKATVMHVTRKEKRGDEWVKERDGYRAQGAEWKKLADRLKNTRRQRARAEDPAPPPPKLTAPEKAEIKQVAELTDIPAETLAKKALVKKQAEAPPKPSAKQVAETLGTVSSPDEVDAILKGRTKLELADVAKAMDIPVASSASKAKIGDAIKERVAGIKNLGVVSRGGFRNEEAPSAPGALTRADLEDMTVPEIKRLEDELGLERPSLNRKDRIDAILAKQGEDAPAAPPAPAVDRETEVENRIRAAYVAAQAKSGRAPVVPGDPQWVWLSDLREELGGDLSREEVDAALFRLNTKDRGTNISPESNQKMLRPKYREAAVSIGNQPRHIIAIDDPSPVGAVDREQAARDRQADIDSARSVATVAGELEQILNDEASDEALLSRMRAAQTRVGPELDRVVAALEAGNRDSARAELARLVEARGATRINGAGDKVPFDPKIHHGEGIRAGQPVEVVRPGYRMNRNGEDIVILRSVVEPAGLPPATSSRVTGERSAKVPTENTWGGTPGPIHFHEDGVIGYELSRMGDDRLMDVDGEPLADHLGRIATANVMGEIGAQEAVDRLKVLAPRLPEGSRARQRVDSMINQLDAPERSMPDLPEGTPPAIRDLVAALLKIPVARGGGNLRGQGGKESEVTALVNLAQRIETGNLRPSRVRQEIERKLLNQRHESVEGKFEIDRAVMEALRRLEGRG